MTQSFSHLMSPGQIGCMKLRNRIIMPPMIKNYATPDGFVTRQLIDHYAARAKGGAGLLIIEASYVHNTGRCWRQGIAIDDDHCILGLANLVDAVKLWGSKIAIQLVHGGRQAQAIITKKPTIAPSAVTYPNAESMPREITLQEIAEMIEAFAQSARRAKEAGFDAIELHGAHGYLISQFFSPNTNRRTDKYGGDLKGRATFALEVIQRTRALVGPDYPIIIRLNGEDTVEGGLTVADSRKLAQILEKAGVNALHISIGTSEANQDIRTLGTSGTYLSPRGHLVDYAAQIKKLVKIPVITVSSLTPEM
ncbi:MAG: NADH:flavin oxidoreductase, partial [Chloroflexota bacterium]